MILSSLVGRMVKTSTLFSLSFVFCFLNHHLEKNESFGFRGSKHHPPNKSVAPLFCYLSFQKLHFGIGTPLLSLGSRIY